MMNASVLKNLKVLVVDDHTMMRTLVSQNLEALGVSNLTTATNGNEALQEIKQAYETGQPYHVVCLDWHMPELEGIEALKQCRADSKYNNTAFVMLTAEQEKANVLKALEAGATGYIVKPVAVDTLKKTLDKVLAWLEEKGVEIAEEPTPKKTEHNIPSELKKELGTVIAKGLQDIFSVLFQVEIVPDDYQAFSHEKNMICVGRLHQQGICIDLRFCFSEDLLKPLLQNIYAPKFLEDDQLYGDAACEIVNILSSQVKAFLNQKGYKLELDLPKLAPDASPSDSDDADSIMNIFFSLSESEVFLIDVQTKAN